MADSEQKIDLKKRRVVAIAGPVHAEFSRICEALKEDRQQVVTGLVSGWNRRNARRAKHRLERIAAELCPSN